MKGTSATIIQSPVSNTLQPVSTTSFKQILATQALPLLILISFATIVPAIASILNQKFILKNNNMYRLFWVGAFLINLITVQIPGRFDSLVADVKRSKFYYNYSLT